MSTEQWTVERSKLVYGIGRNDLRFLDVDPTGNLLLSINGHTVPVADIIQQVVSRNGIQTAFTSSFTLRMPQLIESQIVKLKKAFSDVMTARGYRGEFRAVYPVKVNQRADCVMSVLKSDPQYGVEVGTKTELFLARAVTSDEKHRLIVCNGAKGPEYLRFMKRMAEDGHNIAVSLESLSEAVRFTETLAPGEVQIALRVKPYLTVRGHWSHSGGRDSKFGLAVHDIFDVVSLLKERGFGNSVTTVLGHVGSQITAMEDFGMFARFMFRTYTELRNEGLPNLSVIDFGGGLPIDYTSSSQPDMMAVYARTIIDSVLEEHAVSVPESQHPHILVESGRGITALGSAVLVKILEVRSVFPPDGRPVDPEREERKSRWASKLREATSLNEITEIWTEFEAEQTAGTRTLAAIRDDEQIRGELRAEARRQLARLASDNIRPDRVVESIWHPEHIVIGNFSVFNSILDHVLVNQYFPVIPIRDLHLHPETTVRLVDITCDSDGEISQFHRKASNTIWFTRDFRPLTMPNAEIGLGIPVGNLKRLEGSYFMIPLTGAYQDVIEADHNLLGDLPDVEVTVSDDGQWNVRWRASAQRMRDLLIEQGYTQIDIEEDPYVADD
ncbi:MAG: hypothetical protein HXY34_12340 [Candidatus Thorarchaeota archaeon]|nr:hypothetical protein [Candidatus Thorarchaeota archaeon]